MKPRTKDKDPRSSRVAMKVVITMSDGRTSTVTFCRNLSEGGMFLECVNPPAHGSVLKIEFVMPNNMRKILVQARVVWVRQSREGDENPGIGVRFENIDDASREEIKSAVD